MELPALRERWVQLVRAAPLVLRVTLALTGLPARRAPTGNQARMESTAGAARRERQGPKALPALREPEGRKVGRRIAKPLC
jgi:hypothetical protein